MAISLQQTDFEKIGLVAKHCNLPKLEIAINEAILFDLKPLLCDLYYSVNENWIGSGDFNEDFNLDFSNGEEMDEDYYNLIYPHEYEGCNNKTKSHQGLKNVLTRYAYARYVIINDYDDSPNGGVKKNNSWSIPKPYSDLKQISDRYRTMGHILWDEVENFLCVNREIYDFNSKNCAPCGCNGKCDSETKAKGYGVRGSNVNRH